MLRFPMPRLNLRARSPFCVGAEASDWGSFLEQAKITGLGSFSEQAKSTGSGSFSEQAKTTGSGSFLLHEEIESLKMGTFWLKRN